jgi:hypothetical protein
LVCWIYLSLHDLLHSKPTWIKLNFFFLNFVIEFRVFKPLLF